MRGVHRLLRCIILLCDGHLVLCALALRYRAACPQGRQVFGKVKAKKAADLVARMMQAQLEEQRLRKLAAMFQTAANRSAAKIQKIWRRVCVCERACLVTVPLIIRAHIPLLPAYVHVSVCIICHSVCLFPYHCVCV